MQNKLKYMIYMLHSLCLHQSLLYKALYKVQKRLMVSCKLSRICLTCIFTRHKRFYHLFILILYSFYRRDEVYTEFSNILGLKSKDRCFILSLHISKTNFQVYHFCKFSTHSRVGNFLVFRIHTCVTLFFTHSRVGSNACFFFSHTL